MLGMRAIAMCTHNVYSESHDDPRTLNVQNVQRLGLYRDSYGVVQLKNP